MSEKYVYQEYPKWLAEGVIVKNAEEEKAYRAARQKAGRPAKPLLPAGIAVTSTPPDFEEMSKADLLQFADANKITVTRDATKTELIAEIRAATQKAKA